MLTSMPRLPRLPLQNLTAFRAAGRLQNLRAAADELSLTHSAVSQQIRSLEEQLGFPLFHRHGRRVRLNPAGEALLAPSVTRRLISRFVAQQPAPPTSSKLIDALTAREREVLVMMARGLSNAEIASAFVVSEATVKTHVGRIFAKLDVRDRAQAVIAAYENGLVSPSSAG